MFTAWSHRVRRWAPTGLAALFTGSGILHLVRPAVFLPAVPAMLPARDAIVLGSGIAELVCAGGLISGQRWAGPVSAALLIAIFPGNLAVSLPPGRIRAPHVLPLPQRGRVCRCRHR